MTPRIGRIIIVGEVVLCVLLAAVVGTSSSAAFGGVVPARLMMQTVTPAPAILFEDDFATYSRRWAVTESPKASAMYSNERFNLRVVSPGISVWSVPDFGTPLRDYHIEVTAYVQRGGKGAQFGLVLDGEDDAHFYAFMITLDGAWRFLRHEAGIWHDLTPPGANPVIGLTDRAVRLQVDVTDWNTFAFWFDDQLLQTVTLDRVLSGSVFGLIARAELGFIDVAFDDMLVTIIN